MSTNQLSHYVGKRVNTGKALQSDYYFNNAPGEYPGQPFDSSGRSVPNQYQSGYTPNAPSRLWDYRQNMATETSLRPYLENNMPRYHETASAPGATGLKVLVNPTEHFTPPSQYDNQAVQRRRQMNAIRQMRQRQQDDDY